MKAIIWTKYGPPEGLQRQEVPTPIPKDNEVQIRVHAAAVSRSDTELRRLKLPLLFAIPARLYLGLLKPTRIKIIGTEFAGEIVATGKDVTRYEVGDQVYGYTGLKMGTYAEYLCLPEKARGLGGVISKRPTNISFEEAAAVPFGGLEALHSLERVDLQPGQKILIVGAGGSIGTYSVQLAKHYGAEVTAVDRGEKLEMLRSIGADHVIDFTQEDYTQNGQKYNVILDTIGGSPFWGSIESLVDYGTYLNVSPKTTHRIQMRRAAGKTNKKLLVWEDNYKTETLWRLKKLVEAGALKPIIDRVYPMEQAVEAHEYVETDQKKGNVVLTMYGL